MLLEPGHYTHEANYMGSMINETIDDMTGFRYKFEYKRPVNYKPWIRKASPWQKMAMPVASPACPRRLRPGMAAWDASECGCI